MTADVRSPRPGSVPVVDARINRTNALPQVIAESCGWDRSAVI